MRRAQGIESNYYRAIGSAESLMLKAIELGQRWKKGVSGDSHSGSCGSNPSIGSPTLL